MKKQPFVSVIIVNYKGKVFVEKCLRSILNTNYSNFGVIFVDNASEDGSLKYAKRVSDPRLKIIANEENCGATQGRNIGLKYARGKYIAFLDNDTQVDSDWLENMVNLFESDSTIGAGQSKLLLMSDPSKIDSCGHYLSPFGFPFEIGVRERDEGQYNQINEIFGAKSAAMFIRRSVLDKIGVFDSDYFIYGEETDLCWRVWLAGYRVVFIPKSIVYHALGGTLSKSSGYRIFYEGSKNATKNLLKNLGLGNLLWMLPLHTVCWLGIAILLSLKGKFSDTLWIIKGLLWNVGRAKYIIKERKKVQHFVRKIPDNYIMPRIMNQGRNKYLFSKGISWMKRLTK